MAGIGGWLLKLPPPLCSAHKPPFRSPPREFLPPFWMNAPIYESQVKTNIVHVYRMKTLEAINDDKVPIWIIERRRAFRLDVVALQRGYRNRVDSQCITRLKARREALVIFSIRCSGLVVDTHLKRAFLPKRHELRKHNWAIPYVRYLNANHFHLAKLRQVRESNPGHIEAQTGTISPTAPNSTPKRRDG